MPTSEPSVVMGRHLNAVTAKPLWPFSTAAATARFLTSAVGVRQDSMPWPLPEPVAETLHAQGFRRLLIGHTPHGNCPTIIPSPVRPPRLDGAVPFLTRTNSNRPWWGPG